MKIFHTAVIAAAAACLCACDNNIQEVEPPPPAGPVNFTAFVAAQVTEPTASSQISEPLQVEVINFAFTDDENPAAFNAVIASVP